MAEQKILSVIATTGSRLSDLSIADSQLIFIQDRNTIALDYNRQRKFYNGVVTFQDEQERLSYETPFNGCFYFVINTAVLWFYENDWIQVTSSPEQVIFVGIELPELGSQNRLYINKEKRNISIWDTEVNGYISVGEITGSISNDEIDKIFN